MHMAKLDADIDGLWREIGALTEAGELRRLSGAFARFIAQLGDAPPALILAAAVLSELEGHGHSCLQLDDLAAGPALLLGWSDDAWRQLAQAAAPLPRGVAGWSKLLAHCQQVWIRGEFDLDQPLVLDGQRLYLRRYWRDETLVAQAVRARAAATHPVDTPLVRSWLAGTRLAKARLRRGAAQFGGDHHGRSRHRQDLHGGAPAGPVVRDGAGSRAPARGAGGTDGKGGGAPEAVH
jgi:hypothetical protein